MEMSWQLFHFDSLKMQWTKNRIPEAASLDIFCYKMINDENC